VGVVPALRMAHGLPRQPGFRKPRVGQVDASGLGVLQHVAGDVGQLERQPQVAGAIQRRLVPDAHDPGHHHADDAGHMVAVGQQVFEGAHPGAVRVQAESAQVVERIGGW
jgi:hypothetical protein